jgi:hypothetical protein
VFSMFMAVPAFVGLPAIVVFLAVVAPCCCWLPSVAGVSAVAGVLQLLVIPMVGNPLFFVNLISDSLIDCGLDPIFDNPIVSRICQSDF